MASLTPSNSAAALARIAHELRAQSRFRKTLLPPLILLTDETRLPDPVSAIARLPKRAAVIVRHYRLPPHARRALARDIAAACRRLGHICLIANDAALARAVRADGVHWPEHAARRGRPQGLRFITAAAHDETAIRRARTAGADAVLVSPVFETASHPDATPLGVLRLAALVRGAAVPVYALGGVTQANARRLRAAGVAGIAAIGAIAAG